MKRSVRTRRSRRGVGSSWVARVLALVPVFAASLTLTARPALALEPDAIAAWSAAGGAAGAQFGFSLADAGDVNGDGYDDVLVGAPTKLTSTQRWGEVRLYLGSTSGLQTSPVWTHAGGLGSAYGYSVAGVGDVNGDGYDDILVGFPGSTICHTVTGECRSGIVTLYYGSASGPSTTWSVGGTYAIQQGDNENFGHCVAGAGDLDHDGYADFVVGAPGWDEGGAIDAGRVVVYYGAAAAPSRSTVLTSATAGSRFGWSAAGAGDVDDDGYDDLVVGAPDHHYYSAIIRRWVNGWVAVHRGSADGLIETSWWNANGSLTTSKTDDAFGFSVSGAGDLNGDGHADLVVGDPRFDGTAGAECGRAVVYLGSASGAGSSTQFQGTSTGAHFGWSVAGIGDYVEDGFDDFAIGAPDHPTTGQVAVYRGVASGVPSFHEAWASANQSFGAAVAGGGDVNGDYADDLIVGAPLAELATLTDEGRAFGFHGTPRPRPDLRVEGSPASAPDVAIAGGDVAIGFGSFANRGSAAAVACRVGYYLSTDEAITVDDRLIGTAIVPALAAGTTTAIPGQEFVLPSDVVDGLYHLGLVLDDLAAIEESNETNNAAVCTNLLRVRSGLVVSDRARVTVRRALTGEVPNLLSMEFDGACDAGALLVSIQFDMGAGHVLAPTSGITCTPSPHAWTGAGTSTPRIDFDPPLRPGESHSLCVSDDLGFYWNSGQSFTATVWCGSSYQEISATFDHFYDVVTTKTAKLSEALAGGAALAGEGFTFDAGHAEGWVMRGAYDEYGAGPFSNAFGYAWDDLDDFPNYLDADDDDGMRGAVGFQTNGGHGIEPHGSTWWIMQLVSPDLTDRPEWQTATGYSVQLGQDMSSFPLLNANLYVRVYDRDQARDRTFYNGNAAPLAYGEWTRMCFDWEAIPTFPHNYSVRSVWVNVWGPMSGSLFGGVCLDDVFVTPGRVTSVEGGPALAPRIRLHSAVPNPFNPSTRLRFELTRDGDVDLVVYDVAGRRVRTLLEHAGAVAGSHDIVWDGRDDRGRAVASGTYVVRLSALDRRATQRVVLVK